MELITTVKDFVREASYRHLAPGTHIRVIIDDRELMTTIRMEEKADVPVITPEEQVRLLNRLPPDADPQASEELIRLIETSHTDTTPIDF
jgi:hypothetical protein